MQAGASKMNVKQPQQKTLSLTGIPVLVAKDVKTSQKANEPWSTVLKTMKHSIEPVCRRPRARIKGSNCPFA